MVCLYVVYQLSRDAYSPHIKSEFLSLSYCLLYDMLSLTVMTFFIISAKFNLNLSTIFRWPTLLQSPLLHFSPLFPNTLLSLLTHSMSNSSGIKAFVLLIPQPTALLLQIPYGSYPFPPVVCSNICYLKKLLLNYTN